MKFYLTIQKLKVYFYSFILPQSCELYHTFYIIHFVLPFFKIILALHKEWLNNETNSYIKKSEDYVEREELKGHALASYFYPFLNSNSTSVANDSYASFRSSNNTCLALDLFFTNNTLQLPEYENSTCLTSQVSAKNDSSDGLLHVQIDDDLYYMPPLSDIEVTLSVLSQPFYLWTSLISAYLSQISKSL